MKAILKVESRIITFEGFFTYAEIYRLGLQYATSLQCSFEIEEILPYKKTTKYEKP